MDTGIHIGAVNDEATLEPLAAAIVRIMEAKADQKTIRAALRVLTDKAMVQNVTISNVKIVGTETGGRVESDPDLPDGND